jgi:hypothetical protein
VFILNNITVQNPNIFQTVRTKDRHWKRSWTSFIHLKFITQRLRSILTLFSHTLLRFYPSGSPKNIFHTFCFYPSYMCAQRLEYIMAANSHNTDYCEYSFTTI